MTSGWKAVYLKIQVFQDQERLLDRDAGRHAMIEHMIPERAPDCGYLGNSITALRKPLSAIKISVPVNLAGTFPVMGAH